MDNSTGRVRNANGFDVKSAAVDVAMEGDDETSRATADIRMEIEETRAELADTVEAIEQKLRPSAAMARAADKIKDTAAAQVHALTDAAGETMRTAGNVAQRAVARTRDSAGGVMGMMRDNPLPAALIAVGVGWLLANARRGGRRDNEDMNADADTERYRGEMKTYARAGMDMSSVRRSGQQAGAYLHRMTSDNPLLVGVGALLIGAAFGMALPETERENSLMGDTRDSVVDRAQQMAGDAAARLKERASGVGNAAGDFADSLAPRGEG